MGIRTGNNLGKDNPLNNGHSVWMRSAKPLVTGTNSIISRLSFSEVEDESLVLPKAWVVPLATTPLILRLSGKISKNGLINVNCMLERAVFHLSSSKDVAGSWLKGHLF